MPELKIVKNDDCEFLNVSQAASFLGVTTSTIYAWTMRKAVPHYKLGKLVKFRKSELIKFMENKKIE